MMLPAIHLANESCPHQLHMSDCYVHENIHLWMDITRKLKVNLHNLSEPSNWAGNFSIDIILATQDCGFTSKTTNNLFCQFSQNKYVQLR